MGVLNACLALSSTFPRLCFSISEGVDHLLEIMDDQKVSPRLLLLGILLSFVRSRNFASLRNLFLGVKFLKFLSGF